MKRAHLAHTPMAGGQPLSERVANDAADWLTLLMSGDATIDDRTRLAIWRAAHPDHDRAWQHIEHITGRMKLLEPQAANRALAASSLPSQRRRALVILLFAGGAGATALAWRKQAWVIATADYRTHPGEQRSIQLADGTHITLNTASALRIDFTDHQRVVTLLAGEIFIVTGHALRSGKPDSRPFIVATRQGQIQALGTRFTVRDRGDVSEITVVQDAVAITPSRMPSQTLTLTVGQSARLQDDKVVFDANGDQDLAWIHGQLFAQDEALGHFLARLARYRTGIVRCASEIADLRLSGVFPIRDTDVILDTLAATLPIRVHRLTRFWVTVGAPA